MRTLFTAAVAVAAILVGAPAMAATYVFNTTNASINTFSQTISGATLNMRVSAWQAVDQTGSGANADLDSVQAANIAYYSPGIGIISDGQSDNGLHQIDNTGGVEFLMLQFDQKVTLKSFDRSVFDISTIGGATTSDAAFWADTGNALNSSYGTPINLAGKTVSEQLWTSIAGGASDNTATTGSGASAYVWLLGADFKNTRADGFKLANVQAVYTPAATPQPSGVPEPASWAMMLTGFGAIGGMLRRSRRQAATSLA